MTAAAPLVVAPLLPADREPWQALARGYKSFYETPTTEAEYEAAWQRLMSGADVHGLGVKREGELLGIAHFLFHASAWAESVCYLQDLFTAPRARGQGVARTLIEAVAQQARERGAARYYWLTQEHNAVARTLYDKVARHNGFIRYDYTVRPAGG